MKTFADNSARTWAITVNVAAVKRVRELLQVNVLDIADRNGKLLEQLIEDPCLLCDILYCLCKTEAEAKGVSDEDFGKALAGDALDAATEALLGEIADFFPRHRREVLRRVLQKLNKLQATASALALTKLDDPALDAELERELAASLEAATAKTKGNPAPVTEVAPSSGIGDASCLPESPASIPTPERSAS